MMAVLAGKEQSFVLISGNPLMDRVKELQGECAERSAQVQESFSGSVWDPDWAGRFSSNEPGGLA